MINAAMNAAAQSGLTDSSTLSAIHLRTAIEQCIQAALDADPFLKLCDKIEPLFGDDSKEFQFAYVDNLPPVNASRDKFFIPVDNIEAAVLGQNVR